MREPAVQAVCREFLDDPVRAQPLGIFSGAEELARRLHQDRIPPSGLDQGTGLTAAVAALRTNPALLRAYRAYVEWSARITGPPDAAWLDALTLAGGARCTRDDRIVVFLPETSPETTELARELHPRENRGNPLLEAVRRWTYSLEPGPRAGWRGHGPWALEPFATPGCAYETECVRVVR